MIRTVAAGGVVYRFNDGQVQVLLVARPRTNLWVLPKGRPEPGETLEETALREVSEETGLEVEIVGEVGFDHYSFDPPGSRHPVNKVVHHYLMEPRGGDLDMHDDEYDVVKWLDLREACRLLTFPSQRSIVELASRLIAERAEL